MPSSDVRPVCSVTFHPDSLGSNSVDSNSSRGSSEEQQIDDNDVVVVGRHKSQKVNSTKMSTSWTRSQKVEDELSQLWDTGQVSSLFR